MNERERVDRSRRRFVQAPSRPVLITQLYFPGEPRNATDGIFASALLMNVTDIGSVRQATFTFVLQL